MSKPHAGESSGGHTRSLMLGLQVLRHLVESPTPLSATEIARRCGVHQSSASRALATLAAEGYVRKIGYRSFAPDYGVLELAITASDRFDLVEKPRAAMRAAAELADGLMVSICMLWRHQTIYFLRTTMTAKGGRSITFSGSGFPLHMSSPALLLMLDMPEQQALDLLTYSRERNGWNRPTPQVPATESEVLAAARKCYEHETVLLHNWVEPGHLSAAIRIQTAEEQPTALALAGPDTIAPPETVRLWLHQIRRSVEAALQ